MVKKPPSKVRDYTDLELALYRKIGNRIIPILSICYILACLERIRDLTHNMTPALLLLSGFMLTASIVVACLSERVAGGMLVTVGTTGADKRASDRAIPSPKSGAFDE